MYTMGSGTYSPSLASLESQLAREMDSPELFTMDARLVEIWIARLRSNEYVQYYPLYTTAPMYLCQLRKDVKGWGGKEIRVWSALGVLVDIVVPWKWHLTGPTSTILTTEQTAGVYIPWSLEKEIGLAMRQATQINQLQQAGASFAEIADWIEKKALPHAVHETE